MSFFLSFKKSNKSIMKTIKPNPARRNYIYRAHLQELEEKYQTYEDYLSGKFDENETASTGRNDKTTIHKKTFDYPTFQEWEENISITIEEWKKVVCYDFL